MSDALKVLAEFFTGQDVVHHSVALQAGGRAAKQAERFFAARAALGIRGYADAEEAEAAIMASLTPNA